uniref:cell division protein SepF n=1 Tax=Acidaminococcus fermentans TaxID=905 RepID=UPI003077A7F7
MKKISKLLEYFGLYNGDNRQEEEETAPAPEQEDSKVVPMFGSGSSSWRDKSYEKDYDRPYEKTYDKPYDKVFDRDYDSTPEAPKEEVSSSRTGDKVLSMPVNRSPVSVVVIEPIDFNDSQKMADYLCKNQPVVINFEDTDADVRKRIIDFIRFLYLCHGSLLPSVPKLVFSVS